MGALLSVQGAKKGAFIVKEINQITVHKIVLTHHDIIKLLYGLGRVNTSETPISVIAYLLFHRAPFFIASRWSAVGSRESVVGGRRTTDEARHTKQGVTN